MRTPIAALVVGATALMVGCGSAAAPLSPPSAAALMAKLGCTSLGTDGNAIATNYTVAYMQAGWLKDDPQGPSTLCPAEAIVTFRSVSDENKWLAAYNQAVVSENSCASAVIGKLWAAPMSGAGNPTPIQIKLGGKGWSGGC
jgi:hypothetical protein